MEKIGALTIAPSGDRELVMTRVFDAPRHLVWEAWTRPDLLQRWLGVRGGWSLPVCEMDLRVGGKYRWVWRGTDGQEMGVSGEFREVAPPERIVHTEQFDEAWYEGEGLVKTEFAEHNGSTTVTITLHFVSQAVRDMVLDSPMKGGVAESYDALAELLTAQVAQKG